MSELAKFVEMDGTAPVLFGEIGGSDNGGAIGAELSVTERWATGADALYHIEDFAVEGGRPKLPGGAGSLDTPNFSVIGIGYDDIAASLLGCEIETACCADDHGIG